MNATKKLLSLLLIATITQNTHANFLQGRSFFMPRSQSTNAARELVGWHPYINNYDRQKVYGAFSVTPAYNQSVRPSRIAEALFNSDELNISGSQVATRGANDILADYFGLSPAFSSTVRLSPSIRNALICLNLYAGWHNFYVRVHTPAVWTQWDLNLSESVKNTGNATAYPARYMAENELTGPATSWRQAMRGGMSFGDVHDGLRAGKIDCTKRSTWKVADIQAALGWNFVNRENGHVGFNLRLGAPMGTRPTSEYLFEPVAGNGHHWEVGIGMTGRVLIWEKDGEQELSFFVDINATHLMNTDQCRSFDFCTRDCAARCDERFGSRYILLKEFDQAGAYTGISLPAINVTTLPCKVKVNAQFDIVTMFGYTYNDFVLDFGYNGWIRTKEVITITGSLPTNKYGIKGIQNVRDNVNANDRTTQSNATIHGNNFADQATVADVLSPVFINTGDLDASSAQSPRTLTHKFFTHIGYAWPEKPESKTVPFFGVGAEIEIEGINQSGTEQQYRTTLSQWGLFLKGGTAF